MKRAAFYLLICCAALLLGALAFYGLRGALARRAVDREQDALSMDAPQLAATTRLEILPLYEEAGAGEGWEIGHGVSYLVRTDASTILMDVGDNPERRAVAPFAGNMGALGIAWAEIDALLVSHPHPDHVGGVEAWKSHTLALGDLPADVRSPPAYLPSPLAYPDAAVIPGPALVGPDAATTGVIPYAETWPMSLYEARGGEQALVIDLQGQGLVVVTGCGHPGLETLIERAEALYGRPVIGIVGGLHYGDAAAEELAAPIRFLQQRRPLLVALSPHDSSAPALAAFESAFPGVYHTLRVGEAVRLP